MVDGNIMGKSDPMQPNPVAEQGQAAVAGSKVEKVHHVEGLEDITVVDMHMEGNQLVVVVESESADRVMSTDARNLAYMQRFEKGMTNAGIEAIAGLYVPEAEEKDAKKAGRDITCWRRDFRLTPGL